MTPSLYIHIPFCARKCPYCSFPVVCGPAFVSPARERDYLAALEREAQRYGAPAVGTVYVGGGTPSMLSAAGLKELARITRAWFLVGKNEATFEFNPEQVTAPNAALLAAQGFERASLGMQSFSPRVLAFLGRAHGPQDGFRAFDVLRRAGFANISLDLIFGLPGQTREDLDQDLDEALALSPEHLSLYALTVEEKSLFKVRGVRTADDDQAELYRRACDRLEAAGLRQYEVSNFARPAYESRHNLNYWRGGDYIGLGMGAHSHLDGERFWNAGTFPAYLSMMAARGEAVAGRERLEPAARMMETLLFSLRLNEGADLGGLQQRYGVSLGAAARAALERFITQGLLVQEQGRVRATPRGRLVLDEIAVGLI